LLLIFSFYSEVDLGQSGLGGKVKDLNISVFTGALNMASDLVKGLLGSRLDSS